MKPESFHDLLLEGLKFLYHAEQQVFKSWPRMMRAASERALQSAFQEQLHRTREHAAKLEQIFDKFGLPFRGKRCEALGRFLDNGRAVMTGDFQPHIRDAGLISVAQKIKHYQMAGYGSVRTYSELLGDEEAADLLQQALDEEGVADKKLTGIARGLNF